MVDSSTPITFDVREDEEQYQKLQDCVDLLVASGYFRARVKGLTAFDKIVGGMVWCISICNFTVDVDFLYAENATIGQKISLTEKIVAVLSRLQCPHPIEPHQIQGLDFIHIFPVIRWLVKRAIEVKAEHGDDLVAYSDYLTEKGVSPQENAVCGRFESLITSAAPMRLQKRGLDSKIDSLAEDNACTLAEFTSNLDLHYNDNLEDGVKIVDESLERSSQRDRVSNKTLQNILDSVIMPVSSVQVDVLQDLEKQIAAAKQESECLDKEVEEIKTEMAAVDSQLLVLRNNEEDAQTLFASFSDIEIAAMEQLLLDYNNSAQREKTFKTACRMELSKMEDEIEMLRSDCSLTNDNKISLEDRLSEKLNAIDSQLATDRLQLAEVSRAVALLQRQLDSVPSQMEMTQYQQRFIELYNQMASKHRQTKQYFTLHNTLIDVRNFMKKEIDLLNKIEDVLPQATKDSYRDSFVQNLQEILRLVEGNHEKISKRTAELERQKSDLSTEFAQLKDNEREFLRTSEQFQHACRYNEDLHRRMDH